MSGRQAKKLITVFMTMFDHSVIKGDNGHLGGEVHSISKASWTKELLRI